MIAISVKNQRFIIIELLVTTAIVSILVAIAISALSTYRDSARIGRIASNLRIFIDSFKIYLLDKNCYPPDSHNDGDYNLRDGNGTEDYLPIQAWTSTPDWGGFYNWEGQTTIHMQESLSLEQQHQKRL